MKRLELDLCESISHTQVGNLKKNQLQPHLKRRGASARWILLLLPGWNGF